MLSLGTGAQTRAYTFDEVRGWGQLGWARPALDMVFDGVADTIEFEAGTLMRRALHPPADRARGRLGRPRRRERRRTSPTCARRPSG